MKHDYLDLSEEPNLFTLILGGYLFVGFAGAAYMIFTYGHL
jgi:hypothetical protein